METHPAGNLVVFWNWKGIVLKTMGFGDFFAAWWGFTALLQLSWVFPFGKSPQILIFQAFLSMAQSWELGFPAPGCGTLARGGIWWMEFAKKVMLRGGKKTSLSSQLPIPQPEG